jgi:hypothetical protein
MYKCRDCGDCFSQPDTNSGGLVPYGEGYVSLPDESTCPCCGATSFEEAVCCEICGGYFFNDELFNGICKECEVQP